MAYELNDVPRFTGTFTNASAVNTDPTAVTFTYTKPTGVTTTLTYGVDGALVKSATGIYYVDLALDTAGRWQLVWRGTGTVADADETDIVVGTSHAYCTLDELKDELGITDTTDDAKLTRSINSASRMVDRYCGQRFWQDAAVVDRLFYVANTGQVDFTEAEDGSGDGISTTTGLVVKVDTDYDGVFETTLTINTDFVLLPVNAAVRYPVQPYTTVQAALNPGTYWFPLSSYGRPTMQVTAKWGWPAVPDDINKACLVQAAQLYKAKDTAFDVAGETSFGVVRVRSGLNRTAQGLVDPYAKAAVG